MRRILKWTALVLLGLVVLALAGAAWHVQRKLPQRSGSLPLANLQAAVEVRYDDRGVPHIRAGSEADLYRALGYVHAQDRLFQMELMRRLARGELAEVLGPKLVNTDRLFRTLGLRAHADAYARRMDKSSPGYRALDAYLDGVNQFQASRPAPLEFEVLGIPKRPFTPQDTIAVAGYLAYTFAAALRTEPAMSHVRDKLGPEYLKVFDLDWHAQGVDRPGFVAALREGDWRVLERVAQISQQALADAGVPPFIGSNAWAVSGRLTASGKPLLAGDPHIGFSTPSVWYEAHLQSPGFELYGHHMGLVPLALLGHNPRFGWSMTMFQNDDMDLIVEKANPDNAQQVWHQGRWVDLQVREETIAVKGEAPVVLKLRRSPHGPIITDAFPDNFGMTPVALWWTFLETENPILDAFHQLNRADTLDKARAAAGLIHAPGLNIVWANATGDVAWWAAARLPIRPEGVNPSFLLDGSKPEADKPGWRPFSENPQEENPARGYVLSANHQPASQVPVPGYYHLPDRVQQINSHLVDSTRKWDTRNTQPLQLDDRSGYGPRMLKDLGPVLRSVVTAPEELPILEQLLAWNGRHDTDSVSATVFTQLLYEVARAAMADEMGTVGFKNLLGARSLDIALPRLVADAASPWWDDRSSKAIETRADSVRKAWQTTLAHLRKTFGPDSPGWTWGRAHTLTHPHPLGQVKPLDKLFNVGPFPAPGGREIPNAMGQSIGPAPWAVNYGPSTRRIIDFADATQALGINPVGQSGVWPDTHYRDQAEAHVRGQYQRQWLAEADIAVHTRGTLTLSPAR